MTYQTTDQYQDFYDDLNKNAGEAHDAFLNLLFRDGAHGVGTTTFLGDGRKVVGVHEDIEISVIPEGDIWVKVNSPYAYDIIHERLRELDDEQMQEIAAIIAVRLNARSNWDYPPDQIVTEMRDKIARDEQTIHNLSKALGERGQG